MRAERFGSEASAGPPPWDASRLNAADLVPTMLRRRELDYLHWLAGSARDIGRAVELGCFLGGSTAAIVKGLRDSGGVEKPLLVYDAFVAPDAETFESAPELTGFGLEPDTSFRPLFDRLHASRQHDLLVREGFLPKSSSDPSLYSEGDPIGLLFVDVAKVWGVHLTVQRVFGSRIAPGGVLVQQDFGDFRMPWLVIHMWQLRDVFEPVHRVGSTSTFGFRRTTESPSDALRSLAVSASDVPDDLWEEIIAFWSSVLGGDEDTRGWLAGYRASHAIHARRWDVAVGATREHNAWRESAASEGLHKAPGWDVFLERLPSRIRDAEAESPAARAADRIRHDSERCLPNGAIEEHAEVWAFVRSEFKRLSVRSVVLYGAGRHTRRLLSEGWLGGDVRVERIVDDNPAVDSIEGVPVARPTDPSLSDLPANSAIVPSSDAYELELLEPAGKLAESCGARLIRAYTARRSSL